MEGIFLRKKFNVWQILLFLCGVAFVGFYVFLRIVDPDATSEILVFLIAGILMCLSVIPMWLLNQGAFICVDENTVKAKYHWFGKINCKRSDVEFVSAGLNTLTIQLKDGKTHTIMGLQNSWELCVFLRRELSFETKESSQELINQRNNLLSLQKKRTRYMFLTLGFMFVDIFVTVFLTGGRELNDFSTTDWIIFSVMSATEGAAVILTFCFAQKVGKSRFLIEKLHYSIQRTVIETQPLLPGKVIKVWADENFTGRITVFGYPKEDCVYYTVEQMKKSYTLVDVSKSAVYENIEQLSEELGPLDNFWVDITENFLLG